jgi:hypothetical protein
MNRGTVCTPWIAFGSDVDTGLYMDGGRLCYALDGVRVSRREFFDGCLEKGHLDGLHVLLFTLLGGEGAGGSK